MTMKASDASMEGMTMKAKEISECSDIMPKSLKEHQSKIENACLDMIYLFEQALPALLKEAEERVLVMLYDELIQHTPLKLEETNQTDYDRGYIHYQDMVLGSLNDVRKRLQSLTEPSK